MASRVVEELDERPPLFRYESNSNSRITQTFLAIKWADGLPQEKSTMRRGVECIHLIKALGAPLGSTAAVPR